MNKTVKIYGKDNQPAKLWQVLELIFVGQTFEIDNYYDDKERTYKMVSGNDFDKLMEDISENYSLNWDCTGIESHNNHIVIHVETEK